MRRALLVGALLVPLLGACGLNSDGGDRPGVVVSVYPLEFVVETITSELVGYVHNLTPPGVEPHELELTSDDIDDIARAEVVFYVGSTFQPAVTSAVRQIGRRAMDVTRGVIEDNDPHFWLDPIRMTKVVDRIEAALAKLNPREADVYEVNATGLKQQLGDLDTEFSATLSSCNRKAIVTAHAAFGYLDRYGITQHAISGVSPEGEPSPARIAELSRLIERTGVTTVFYEDLVPRDFAETLAKDAGVTTAVLNPLEALTKKEEAAGEDYISVMRKNLAALADALECQLKV